MSPKILLCRSISALTSFKRLSLIDFAFSRPSERGLFRILPAGYVTAEVHGPRQICDLFAGPIQRPDLSLVGSACPFRC